MNKDRKMLINACVIHLEHTCVRYVMACSRKFGNGAEKAIRHMEICQFLTAIHLNKIDPSRIDVRHPFYQKLHDDSQKFTSNLRDVDNDFTEEGLKLADNFMKLFLEMVHE